MSFDLSDQLSPSINIKSISSSDDIGFIHPDTSFVVTSTEPLERSDGSAITNDNIKDYITLEYWADSESIDYTAIVNENKTAIEIKPDYAEPYLNMGYVLSNKGDLDEAIDSFKKAISIKPDYAEAYNNMGASLQDQGNIEEAINGYKKAISINPDYARE